MKRTAVAVLVLFVAGLLASGCGKKEEGAKTETKPSAMKSIDMKEGKWEITSTFEMQGMPAGMMPPQTVTTCLSQKDYVPKDKDQQDCTMKDTRVDGNTVSWSMICKDASSKGRVTYAGTTFDGVTEMIMKEGGKETTAKMTMKGKHIGSCP